MGIDIALVVATDTEWKAILNCGFVFENPKKIKTTFKQCLQTRTANGLEIVAVQAEHMGQVHASIAACKLVYELQPFLIISFGVAAGLPGKTALFDVLIPEIVHDASLGKVEVDPVSQQSKFKFNHRPGKCNREAVTALKTHFELNYAKFCDESWLRDPKVIDKNSQLARPHWEVPIIHTSDILCDNLVHNDAENLIKAHADSFRDVVGCEMECYGFTEAIHYFPLSGSICQPRFAMVKGVVDFALKKDSDFQSQVAMSVARCLHSFLTATFPNSGLGSQIETWRTNRNKNTRQRVINLVGNHQRANSEIQNTVGSNLIDVALIENESLINGTFSVFVDASSRYLNYAKPIFSNATTIFAISIDSVSRFWTSQETFKLARDYLEAQESHRKNRRDIARVFVFHSAEQAHRHGQVLDAHLKAYENVFVCSSETYPHLIKDAVKFNKTEDILSTDFAVLGYGQKLGGNCPIYLGTLGPQQFTFYKSEGVVKMPGIGSFDTEKLAEVFGRLKGIKQGKIEKVKLESNSCHVLAWADGMWERRDWAGKLGTLFPGEHREAMHMVFLCPTESISPEERLKLKKRFSEIKAKLLKPSGNIRALSDKYNIVDICFGERIRDKFVAVDALTKGRLELGKKDNSEFVLKIKFKSLKDLAEFYNDDAHSEIRHIIYALVSRTVDIVFKDLKALTSSPTCSGVFELAEAEMRQYLHRRDFYVGDEIESIVEQEPYSW